MLVGSLCGQFDLMARPIQQILGFSSMALHVPLVGDLRVSDFDGSLVHEFLCFKQVWVPMTTHVLGYGYATCDKSEDQRTAQKYIADFHGISSRATMYQISANPL